MSSFSLSSEMKIEVTASFIQKGSDTPLTGSEYEFRLFEKDLMEDDYLGVSPLDEHGTAKVSFTHADFKDILNPETSPDLYFALYKGEELIFQSEVMEDVDIPSIEQFKMGEGEVVDLGTFLI
jgi:hypothetical protein